MKYSFPTLYLFNNVFFPETLIPLNVSDDISKEVLAACHQKNLHIVFYHPNSKRQKKVGTLGEILSFKNEEDEKKGATALVRGVARVELLTQEQHIPFPVYQVDDYLDIDHKTLPLGGCIERLHLVLQEWLLRHVSSVKEREHFMKNLTSTQSLVNNLCLLVIKDVTLKEIFLESTSLHERIRMLDALLQGTSPEVEDMAISEAIKSFDKIDSQHLGAKNAL